MLHRSAGAAEIDGNTAKAAVAGTQTCGVRMPQNRTPLSAANIALIKNWIDQGAMNN